MIESRSIVLVLVGFLFITGPLWAEDLRESGIAFSKAELQDYYDKFSTLRALEEADYKRLKEAAEKLANRKVSVDEFRKQSDTSRTPMAGASNSLGKVRDSLAKKIEDSPLGIELRRSTKLGPDERFAVSMGYWTMAATTFSVNLAIEIPNPPGLDNGISLLPIPAFVAKRVLATVKVDLNLEEKKRVKGYDLSVAFLTHTDFAN